MGVRILTDTELKLKHQTVVTTLYWKRHTIRALGTKIMDTTQYHPYYFVSNGAHGHSVNAHVLGWKVVCLKPKHKKFKWAVLIPSTDPRYKFRIMRDRHTHRRRYFSTPANAILAADKHARWMLGHKIAALGKGKPSRAPSQAAAVR